jgi:antirestriction protein ArdC
MPDCPPIKHKEQKAFYNIEADYINMPKKKSFVSNESYYSTLFHELVHSTGHEKRLNRKTVTEAVEFGSETYSLEELIAELGCSYLCNSTGIINTEIQNSVAYIEGWLKLLKSDKRYIIRATGFSQKAVDFICNVPSTKDTSKEEIEASEFLTEE